MFEEEEWDTGPAAGHILSGVSGKLPTSSKKGKVKSKHHKHKSLDSLDNKETQQSSVTEKSGKNSKFKDISSVDDAQKNEKLNKSRNKNKFKNISCNMKVVGSELRSEIGSPSPTKRTSNDSHLENAKRQKLNETLNQSNAVHKDTGVPENKQNKPKKRKRKKKNVQGDIADDRNIPNTAQGKVQEPAKFELEHLNTQEKASPKSKKSKKKNKLNARDEVDLESSTPDDHLADNEKIILKKKNKVEETKETSKQKNTRPSSLAEAMRERLKAARFRYLNEQMYSQTGEEAQEYFKEDPEAFSVYHEGFEAQVSKWPLNPVKRVIRYIKSKPKTNVIADFGCGDAKVARGVPNEVHSFDLVAINEHVTACDMANVPLEDGSVDIAVFCLSLMGTNLVDYLQEARRVLKMGGVLLVAEVTSRFDGVWNFIKSVEKLGFKIHKKDDSTSMFVWFEFTKIGDQKSKIPEIELAPCIYKKR